MTIPVEALEAAKLAVFNSQLGIDRYDGSPNDYDTDMRSALEAALPLLADPIETGREAALAQWHERWRQLHDICNWMMERGATQVTLVSIKTELGRIAARIPVGNAPALSHQEVMRRTAALIGFEPDNHHNALKCPYCIPPGRVTFQLEPARARRLVQVLRSAGAHPSGLGSYEAANDANAFADDLEGMIT